MLVGVSNLCTDDDTSLDRGGECTFECRRIESEDEEIDARLGRRDGFHPRTHPSSGWTSKFMPRFC
jgi:hypothetical protein